MNLKFFFFCLVIIFSSLSLAQKNNIGLIRGTTSYPEWKITGDYSSYSTVFFKASLGNNQYLQKIVTKSYVSPFTTLKCTLNVNDTQDLSPGDYYYNVYAFGADTLVLVAGWMKLTRNVALDPIPLTFPRYTIVALDTPNTANTFIVGQDSDNVWYRRTPNAVRTLLGIDTLTNAGSLPDSIIYTSETADFVTKSTTQDITAQKNFMGTIPIKLGADTSIYIGGYYGGVPTGLRKYHQASDYDYYNHEIVFPQDTSEAGAWRVGSIWVDWDATRVGTEWSYGMEYNFDRKANKPWMSFTMEPEYEVPGTGIYYEWWFGFHFPSQNILYDNRPFQINQLVPYSGNPDSVTGKGQLVLDELWFGNSIKGSDANTWDFTFGSGTSTLAIEDTFAINYRKNNLPWLYQVNNVGTAVEMMRIDDEDHLVLSPSTGNDIEFASPIDSSIRWRNNANNAYIEIQPDSTNWMNFSNDAGVSVQNLKIRGLQTDTTGTKVSDLYADPNTGVVHYNLGVNLLTNGDFTNWSGIGKKRIPDDWTFTYLDTLVSYVEESPAGKLHFVTDGSVVDQLVSSVSQDGSSVYGYSFYVSQVVDSFNVFMPGWNVTITQTGYYSGENTSSTINPLATIVPLSGVAEITIDNYKIWKKYGAKQASSAIYVPDTTGVVANYILRYNGAGTLEWTVDNTSDPGTGLDSANVSSLINDFLGTLSSVYQPLESTLTDIADGTITENLVNTANPWTDNEVANNLTIDDAGIASTIARDSEVSTLLTAFADTIRIAGWSIGMGDTNLDTITAGSFGGIKIENNYTITEVSAYTNTGTVTFNIEERGETTPNTAGTDVMGSDLVADTDQQETGTFSNATIDRNDWLILTIASTTGDPTVFSVTVFGIKTN